MRTNETDFVVNSIKFIATEIYRLSQIELPKLRSGVLDERGWSDRLATIPSSERTAGAPETVFVCGQAALEKVDAITALALKYFGLSDRVSCDELRHKAGLEISRLIMNDGRASAKDDVSGLFKAISKHAKLLCKNQTIFFPWAVSTLKCTTEFR